MKLFLISQDVNQDYDTYDAFVVAAESQDIAQHTHPDGRGPDLEWWNDHRGIDSWTHPANVQVRVIAESTAESAGVVLASFNAG